MTTTTAATSPIEILKAAAAERDTETLIGALIMLDAKGNLDEAERLTAAAISDVVETRHNLTAAMDAIYEDVSYEGTYTEALIAALAATR